MGNIEKYGVVALLFVIVMVLAVSIWGPRSTDKPPLEQAAADSTAPKDAAGETVKSEAPANPPAGNGAPTAKPLAPAPAVEEKPVGEFTKYKVKKDDTLEGIALSQLGSKTKWNEILKANEGLNPSRLKIGQEILIPSRTAPATAAPLEASGTREKETTTAVSGKKSHKTAKNDTLYDIAKKYYGNGGKWKKIYDANKDKIRDPELLPEGVELTIP